LIPRINVIDAFKKSFNVPFPLFADGNLAITQAVGVTETPSIFLVTHSGKVLTSYSGVIQDFDGLLRDPRENHKRQ
jgi:hypothetical protein